MIREKPSSGKPQAWENECFAQYRTCQPATKLKSPETVPPPSQPAAGRPVARSWRSGALWECRSTDNQPPSTVVSGGGAASIRRDARHASLRVGRAPPCSRCQGPVAAMFAMSRLAGKVISVENTSEYLHITMQSTFACPSCRERKSGHAASPLAAAPTSPFPVGPAAAIR